MLSEVLLDSYNNHSTYKKLYLQKSQSFISKYSWDKVSKDLYDVINKRYGSVQLDNQGYIKFHKFSEDLNGIFFSQKYFDSCKVYIEITNEKGDVYFFSDLTMIKNVEHCFGSPTQGKKIFTIYDSNKSIILFRIASI
jgi:hypothetical protein